MVSRKKPPRASDVVGERLKAIRQHKEISQQQLAERLKAIGENIDRGTIAKLEGNVKRGVSLDELFALAAALEVSPLALTTPPGRADEMTVATVITAKAASVRNWIKGLYPLEGQDRNFYFREVPEEDSKLANEHPGLKNLIESCQLFTSLMMKPDRSKAATELAALVLVQIKAQLAVTESLFRQSLPEEISSWPIMQGDEGVALFLETEARRAGNEEDS